MSITLAELAVQLHYMSRGALAPRDILDLKLCDNFNDLPNVGWVLILWKPANVATSNRVHGKEEDFSISTIILDFPGIKHRPRNKLPKTKIFRKFC